MKIAPTVIDELVRGANSDIRLVLNMLSTYKLGQAEMDFDQGKELYVSLFCPHSTCLTKKCTGQREEYDPYAVYYH
jgi:replication factor C subunit 1